MSRNSNPSPSCQESVGPRAPSLVLLGCGAASRELRRAWLRGSPKALLLSMPRARRPWMRCAVPLCRPRIAAGRLICGQVREASLRGPVYPSLCGPVYPCTALNEGRRSSARALSCIAVGGFRRAYVPHPASQMKIAVLLGLVALGAAAAEGSGGCAPWCLERFARSWACETHDCAGCHAECMALSLPDPAISGKSPQDRGLTRGPWLDAGMTDSWTCDTTWPPRTFYVVFSMARSASTATCSVLNTLPNTK